MKYENTIFIVGLLLFVLLSVSVVSANDNTTSEIINDNNAILEVSDENFCGNDVSDGILEIGDETSVTGENSDVDYNFKIIAPSKYEEYYGYEEYYSCGKPITIQVKSLNDLGDYTFGATLYFDYSNGKHDIDSVWENEKLKVYPPSLKVGTYTCTVSLDDNHVICTDDENYAMTAKPVTITINIKKASVILTAKKITAKKNTYFTLKATVTHKQLPTMVGKGTINFKINGKTYSVKVKNGVATKKIKLSKAKTYKYTATFTHEGYYSKTISSKVVIKNTQQKYFTIKVGKYKCKISAKEYDKIQDAITDGKTFSKKYDTGKTVKYNVYKYKKVTATKKKLYIDSYSSGSKLYNSALNTPNGYKYVGQEVKHVNGHVKHYMVYKKTTHKNVKVATKNTKVYIKIKTYWGSGTASVFYLKSDYDGQKEYYEGSIKVFD